MICQFCEHTDGCEYTSLPPQIKCTITGEFHFKDHECDIEFVPLKTGKWMFEEYPDGYYSSICSNCGLHSPEEAFLQNWKYCPNCGARMIEGREEC